MLTNRSIVASIWWKLAEARCWSSCDERVEALGQREAAEDVDQARRRPGCAESSRNVTKPMDAPISAWVSAIADQRDGVLGQPPRSSAGTTANARPSASTPWPASGTALEENGGATSSHATIRTEASR